MVGLISLSTELDWLPRILVVVLYGTAIGYECITQGKSAGIRTHMVAAVASAPFMLVPKYGLFDLLSPHDISLDPSRIAAQIVTGIPLAGTGTILVRREQISGLTTTASVRATATIGMAMGAGMYIIGIISTVFLFIIQIIFYDDIFINFIILHVRFNVRIEANNRPDILSELERELALNEVEQISIKIVDVTSERVVANVDGVVKSRKGENDIILVPERDQNARRINSAHGAK